jgi:hypothetical protein
MLNRIAVVVAVIIIMLAAVQSCAVIKHDASIGACYAKDYQ